MAELKEIFEMVTNRAEPDLDAWQGQERRQRRAARGRKVGAVAVVLVTAVGLAAVWLNQHAPANEEPATHDTPPVVAPTDAPPVGAQIISTNGETLEQIPGLPEDAHWLRASPDGDTIVFRTWSNNYYQVATIKIDGRDLRILTDHGYSSIDAYGGGGPTWSPDGSRIAYTDGGAIYVMDADGANARRITAAPGGNYGPGNYGPAWSPDGSELVYWFGDASGSDGELYTIGVDGGQPRRLTHNTVRDAYPDWSTTGWIVYEHGGPDGGVWIMRSDGSDAHRVADGGSGRWSPNGTKLVYQTLRTHPDGGWDVGDIPGCEGCALLRVHVLDMKTGEVTDLPVRYGGDLNTATWLSNHALLVNRYD